MDNITSRDNKFVKDFVKLSASKSYRDSRGLFALEGIKLVMEAFNSNICFEMVFVTASCQLKNGQELEKLFQAVAVVQIADELEKKMSNQTTPQGIFAICMAPRTGEKAICLDEISGADRLLMLVDLQDPGNVGTIVRTAEALGIDGIIVTDKTCDLFSPKVIRASMGSVFRMKYVVVCDPLKTITMLAGVGVNSYAAVLDADAIDINNARQSLSLPLVLLIGNEGNGLSDDVASCCNDRVTIVMPGKAESLNASMAAGILMWEIMAI